MSIFFFDLINRNKCRYKGNNSSTIPEMKGPKFESRFSQILFVLRLPNYDRRRNKRYHPMVSNIQMLTDNK